MTTIDLLNRLDMLSVPEIYAAMTAVNDQILRSHRRVTMDLLSLHRHEAPAECYDLITRRCYYALWAASTAIMQAMRPWVRERYIEYCKTHKFPATENYR